jgi:hypothetical protein
MGLDRHFRLADGSLVQLPRGDRFGTALARQSGAHLALRFIEGVLRIHVGAIRLVVSVLDLQRRMPDFIRDTHFFVDPVSSRRAQVVISCA